MPDHMTKADLLEKINISYAEWEALVRHVPAARMTEAGFEGEWSLKDVIAHLTVYEHWIADNLEAAARGETHKQTFAWEPPGGDIEDTDEQNAIYYQHYKDAPLAEVLAANRKHHQQLIAAVERLSESDLNAADTFAWSAGYPVWRMIEGNAHEHYDDHKPALRAWLAIGSQAT